MTVYENIAFGLRRRKVPKHEIDRIVQETAEILEITELLKRKPKQLSGGQRQRVAIDAQSYAIRKRSSWMSRCQTSMQSSATRCVLKL